ncbi:suppressor of IKBKE 1-like isoform X3 [Paramacrobiotus metropolitanus]|uniref:suppressor of IKBKE 1-like isoform X3 n=1 Tax=Paramacrobiotus metropolitanus TaxID=2943436 RepID=UPI002445E86B|nr:suppressor of IKBKE 1-like isoform X3 [Paramacrobiotus metropolitanus]XP_055328067.1 suppressor of IKBKE 1-like isoform X3 [Paramacrobiotus metropolitanus]
MSLTLSDALNTARNLVASMRQRDATMESSRRSARASLHRLESALDADSRKPNMPDSHGIVEQELVEPFPDFIMNSPEHRELYDSNRELYHVVAEQQITLQMIMEKYRMQMMELPSATNYMMMQKLLEKYEDQTGILMHEKGVALQVMGDAVWEDDDADFVLTQHSAQMVTENETLRMLVQHSLRTNGISALSLGTESGAAQIPQSDDGTANQNVSQSVGEES